MRNINYIVIHCTATSPDEKVQSILNYWKNNLKWKNVGYHYIINKIGSIIKLSDEKHITNGAKGYNHESIHIAYIGGAMGGGKYGDTRTKEQREEMAKLVKRLSFDYPTAKIVGHRDLSPDKNHDGKITPDEWIKLCPCFSVSQWLKEINL